MRKVSAGKMTLGLVLVALGAAAFMDICFGTSWLSVVLKYWPAALVLLGLEFILYARNPENRVRLSVGALVAIGFALMIAYGYEGGYEVFKIDIGGWGSWSLSQPYENVFALDQVLDGVATVEVRSIGDVTVTGGTGQRVQGEIRISVRASDPDVARDTAASWKPGLRVEGSSLIIDIEAPRIRPVSFNSRCQLNVPEGINVKVRTVSGDVEIRDVAGALEVNSVSGDITVDGRPVSLDLTTVSGAVDAVTGTNVMGIRVHTVSGDVDIKLADEASGDFYIETVSGNIMAPSGLTVMDKSPGKHVEGKLGTGSPRIRVDTTSGDVDIR